MNNLFMERPLRSAAAEGFLGDHVLQRIPEHDGGHPSNAMDNGASQTRGPALVGQVAYAGAANVQNAAAFRAQMPNHMPKTGCDELDLDEARGFEARQTQGFASMPPRTAAAGAALEAVPAIPQGPAVAEGSGRAPLGAGVAARAGSRPASNSAAGAADAQTAHPAPNSPGPYSVAQEAYRAELDHDKKRSRKRKLHGILRVLLMVVLVPVLLVAIFLASYALTCIINGATPEELVRLMGNLFARVEGFAHDVMQRI